MTDIKTISRRTLVKTGIGALAAPAVLRVLPVQAQSQVIKIGHVSPKTGPLAGFGERELATLRRIGARRVALQSSTDDASKSAALDIITLTAKDDLFAQWLAETGATAAVVRPDRYVYGVARTPAELARLVGDLGRELAA